MKNKIILTGKNPGPTSIVMAGNHGNEICGIVALQQLLPYLTIEAGTVIFILGNIQAIKENKRFIDFNLNRLFSDILLYSKEIKKSYEYKRAQILKKVFDLGDALLDIHSTLNPSTPFIICEDNAKEIVSKFPARFERIVYGFDPLEPGASDGYMLSKGKIGICIECGQHNDPMSIEIAKKSIYAFLKARGHINYRSISFDRPIVREYVKMFSIYKSKTDSFVLSRKFYDFEPIAEGTKIGADGCNIIYAPKDCLIVFAHDCNKIDSEAFLLGEII
ncbi:MAG: hypothetical protein QG566_417 [Patescibacteria group bacterium]|jgi:succinylglutamate desuccinylase|nr:hypothetical protein [Patescibacteria group bacterium]